MCVTRFNLIMTLLGGRLTRIDAINLVPFHSIRENLGYGRGPISWDMRNNMAMFVPFGIIYCYYQNDFHLYKAIGLSCFTTFLIEVAQFVLKTGVVDIDDFIINTVGSLIGIALYVVLREIAKQKWEIHEMIDIIATVAPPMLIAFAAEMFLGDGTPKLWPAYSALLLCYGVCVCVFLIKDLPWKSKMTYLVCYVGAFYLSLVVL